MTNAAATSRHQDELVRHERSLVQKAVASWRTWFLALLLVAAVIFAAFHWGDVKLFA